MASLRRTFSLKEGLQARIQGDGLTCAPGAPPWIGALNDACRDDLGLLALHGPQGLSERLDASSTVRVPLAAPDNLALLLIRQAIVSGRHLAIAAPAGTVMMPMVMVCKTLLGDLLEEQEALADRAHPNSIRERGGVMVVSPDVELRVRYFGMHVGPEPVVASYPACRLRPDGTTAPITTATKGNAYSVCFFLAQQKQLPEPAAVSFTPAVVILDLTHDRWIDCLGQIIAWCLGLRDRHGQPSTLIALVPFGDRLSSAALREHHVPIFPLDTVAIDAVAAGYAPPPAPADGPAQEAFRAWSFGSLAVDEPLRRQHILWHVPDEAAGDVLRTLGHIQSALGAANDQRAPRDFRLAGWLAATLTQLPIPLQWYEQHAFLMGNRQTLRKLIGSIGNHADGTVYREFAPLLQSLRGQLELLYTRLDQANPKSELFLYHARTQLMEHLGRGEHIAVLARNDVVARALVPWLVSEQLPVTDRHGFRVLAYKQVTGRELFDRVVATGPWPGRYRWQLGSRLGRTIDFLLFPGEETFLQRQIGTFYGPHARAAYARTRADLLGTYANLTSETLPVPAPAAPLCDRVPLGTPADSAKPSPLTEPLGDPDHEASVDLPAVASLFARVAIDPAAFAIPASRPDSQPLPEQDASPAWPANFADSDAEPPTLEAGDETITDGGPTETCHLLTLRPAGPAADENERYLYLPHEGSTDCYVPSEGDNALTAMPNDELAPGYILIRTDRDDRGNLFDRIVELADAQPTMRYLKAWRQYWLDAVAALVQKHDSGRARRGTYQQIQQQLASAGVRVTPMTIRNWVLGTTIGPGSLEAIVAVGKLSQNTMLLQYPQQVDKAFRQIRTIHQLLGRRISAALQRATALAQPSRGKASARSGGASINLDPALAVPLDDLLDLLQYWEVVDIDQGPFTVPTAQVGVILARKPTARLAPSARMEGA